MTLVEWTPKNSLLNYFSNIDRIFDNILPHSIESENQVSYFTPSMDVIEHASEYIISLDLPGVEKKDIEVSMNDGQVVVLAERKNNIEKKSN